MVVPHCDKVINKELQKYCTHECEVSHQYCPAHVGKNCKQKWLPA